MPDPLRQTVSASQIAALYGRSPYLTEWMLYQHFTGAADLPEEENDRMMLGRLLEPVILQLAAKRLRLEVSHNAGEHYHRGAALGCTIDAAVTCPSRGLGVVQAKNVDYLIWRDAWSDTAAPPHVELQIQCELAALGGQWGVIAALVGGNDLLLYERRRDDDLIADMQQRAADFLERVAFKNPPPMEGRTIELPQLDRLYVDPPEIKTRDAREDRELSELVREYAYWTKAALFAKKNSDELRPKLLAAAGDVQELRTHGALVKIARTETHHGGPELPEEIADKIIRYLSTETRDPAAVPVFQDCLLMHERDVEPTIRTAVKVKEIDGDGPPPWESWVPDVPEFG